MVIQFLSAKGAKCKSLGQRPRLANSFESQRAESAKYSEGKNSDGPILILDSDSSGLQYKEPRAFHHTGNRNGITSVHGQNLPRAEIAVAYDWWHERSSTHPLSLGRVIKVADLVEEAKTESSKWIKTKGREFRNFHWQRGYGAF